MSTPTHHRSVQIKRATILTCVAGTLLSLGFVGYASEWQLQWTLFSTLAVLWNCSPGIISASLTEVAARRVGGAAVHLGASGAITLGLVVAYFEGFVRSPDAQNAILLLVVLGLQLGLLFLAFVWISFLPVAEIESSNERRAPL